MDNNQYYNNVGVQPVPPVQPQPVPVQPDYTQSYNQPVQPNYTEQAFAQPVYNQTYQQPVQNTVPVQPVQPVNQLQSDPVVQPTPVQPQPQVQDPNQVFGSTVVSEQIATTRTEQVSPLLQKHEEEEAPKYGAATEGQADLNEDKNGSLKFVIIIGILVLAFIIALPYLSEIFSKFMGSAF